MIFNSLMRRSASPMAVLALVTLLLFALPASAQTRTGIDWADWQAKGPDVVLGSMDLGGGEVADITFSGSYFNAMTDALPEPYWGPAATYRGTQIANAPPMSDAIFVAGGPGRMALTFSQPVVDPVIAIASLGLTNGSRTINIQTAMWFEQSFEILSNGSNYYANAQFNPFTRIGDDLYGIEASGVIRFRGTFSEIAWTSPLREENELGVLVGTYMFTVGSGGCDNYELGPSPLATAHTVRAGCQAYTRGSFSQQAQVDVRGGLRNEGAYSVQSVLDVAAGGRVENFATITVAQAGTINLRGTMDGGAVNVSGRLQTFAGSLWSLSSLIVNEGGQVIVGGVVTSPGFALVNGLLQIDPGANMAMIPPLLVSGVNALLDVRGGAAGAGQLQAFGGLQVSAGATVSVGGQLTVNSTLTIHASNVRVLAGGTLATTASGTIQGAFENAGSVQMAGGDISFDSGASVVNTGSWRIGTDSTVRIGTGVTLQNMGQLQIFGGSLLIQAGGGFDSTGQVRIGPGGTMLFDEGASDWRMLAGRLDIDHGGRLEFGPTGKLSTANAARIDNSGTIVLRSAAAFENGASYVMQAGSRIEVDAGARIVTGGPRFEIAPGADILGAGTFEQVAGITIVNGSISLPLSVFNGGVLMGSGTVFGNSVLGSTLNGGSVHFVRPGNSPGTITFAGDVVMENAVIEIEAADFDRLDRIVVTGRLEVHQVEARFITGSGFQPDLNDSGTWLVAFDASGLNNIVPTIDTLTAGWELRQSSGYVALWNPNAFPLPASSPFQLTSLFPGDIAYVNSSEYVADGPIWIGGSLAVLPGGVMRSAHSIEIAAEGRMTNRGDVRITGVGFSNAGRLENRADGLLRNESDSMRNRGYLINTGRLENAGRLINEAGATLEQRGTVVNEPFASIVNRGRIVDSGRIEQADTGFFQNDSGFLHVTPTGQFVGGIYEQAGTGAETVVDGLLAASEAYIRAGVLSGRGHVAGPISFDDGALAPAGSIVVRPGGVDAGGRWGGALTFDVGARFGSGSVIEIMITGDGAHGRLALNAGAYFDPGAALRFVLSGGYLPESELVVPFLDADPVLLYGFDRVMAENTQVVVRSALGDAAWAEGGWSLVGRADGLDLHLAPVPEPWTYAMMIAALALLAWRVGRRDRKVARAV